MKFNLKVIAKDGIGDWVNFIARSNEFFFLFLSNFLHVSQQKFINYNSSQNHFKFCMIVENIWTDGVKIKIKIIIQFKRLSIIALGNDFWQYQKRWDI